MKDRQAKQLKGRPALIGKEHETLLNALVTEAPHASLAELTREFTRRTGLGVCTSTMSKGLKQAGITRLKPTRAPQVRAPVQGGSPRRVGYTERHRRQDGLSGLNTDLTDAEWALVADLFERSGGRGKPVTHDRRVLVNACCYVVRTVAFAAEVVSAMASGLQRVQQLGEGGCVRSHARSTSSAMA
jgi:hypothetical protein